MSLDREILEAAGKCSRPLLEALLERGADVNSRSTTGQTPLIRTVSRGKDRAVKAAGVLLDGRADPNLMDRYHRHPLWYAVERRSIPMAKLLLDRGADPNLKDYWDPPLLEWAVLPPRDLELVRCLLDGGADPNQSKYDFSTAMDRAIYHQDLECVRLLLDYGADPDLRTPTGRSSMHLSQAIMFGGPAILEELLQRGAGPDLPWSGLTPLTHASVIGNADAVRLLLERGADPELACSTGETPLQCALSKGYTEVADILREAGANS